MKKVNIYRKQANKSLFEEEFTASSLSRLGNPLETLSKMINFEMFREDLEDVLIPKESKSAAGRPRFDSVQMFKILVLQRLYGLGDHQLQYQISDRTSFRQFLGISTIGDIPDEKTVWWYREKLSKSGAFDTLFERFRSMLDSEGLSYSEGKIIDASFVEAPRQRTTREESKIIKEGRGDELWGDSPHKKSHKDTDARWTMKRGERHYGYKCHVKADAKTKLVETYHTTPASVHDSNIIADLLRGSDKGQKLYLDAGYEGREDVVAEHGMTPVICEKGHRGHPLTDEQVSRNREKSRTRCRVEHIFGFVQGSMRGSLLRSIGKMRAGAQTALTCLIYNFYRYAQIVKYQPRLIACKG